MTSETKIAWRFAVGSLIVLSAVLSGCVTKSNPTEVQGRDSSVFFPSVRVAWDIKSDAPSPQPSQPHSGHALELLVVSGSGDSTQIVVAGQQPIRFNGVTFNPPQTIQEQFDIFTTSVSYRYRKFFGRFGMEFLGGVGYRSLDTTLDSGAQRTQERSSSGYVAGGAGAMWRFTPNTSVQGRISVGVLSSDFYFVRSELVVAQSLTKHAGLRAGWATWSWNNDQDVASEQRVKLSGPTLGLEFEF